MDWRVLGADLLAVGAGVLVSLLVALAVRSAFVLWHRVPPEQQEILAAVARMAVQYVEQVMPVEQRAEKQRQALNWAQWRLNQLGLKVDAYTLAAAIEAAVYAELRHGVERRREPVPVGPPPWAAAEAETASKRASRADARKRRS